jgi:hypothetical protein
MSGLRRLVEAEAGAIADHVRLGLQCGAAPHYQRLSDLLLRRRCRRLVDAFAESTEGDPEPLVAYVRDIANERIAEGVGLEEIQRALTLLEGRAWASVIGTADIERLVGDLAVVTRTIGMAKDELARRYLAGQQRKSGSALAVPTLFAGTDGIPETGETEH